MQLNEIHCKNVSVAAMECTAALTSEGRVAREGEGIVHEEVER